MADFLRVPLENGGEWVRLDRLDDGRVMCQLCFEYKTLDELNDVEGGKEDVCRPCAVLDSLQARLLSILELIPGEQETAQQFRNRVHQIGRIPGIHPDRDLGRGGS
jgi:hypothetical protein